jgi:hypothetical protein
MGLSVTFVSGPRRSGKSAFVQAMIDALYRTRPHYFRLVKSGSDKQAPKASSKPAEPGEQCGVASARWMEYDDDQVFAILPEALSAIHKRDRYGSVVIEADADPTLRCAYPYDHRVFVMPLPGELREVFRDSKQAASELQRVLDDTAAFASEIFGLFHRDGDEAGGPAEDRSDLTHGQMRGFLYSPLGDELATRIQLQQPYHGLVESDVIVVNTSAGQGSPETDACLRRINTLLDRLRGAGGRRGELFLSELSDRPGALDRQLLKALKPMCAGGK